MKRIMMLICACAFMCGCAKAPTMINTFMPGEEPPVAVVLERGTRISTPDGKEYVLGCDGVVLSRGHWIWVISALDHIMKERDTMYEKGL